MQPGWKTLSVVWISGIHLQDHLLCGADCVPVISLLAEPAYQQEFDFMVLFVVEATRKKIRTILIMAEFNKKTNCIIFRK